MSQNVANTSLPTPTTTQDWSAILDEAIQLASDNDKETADAKQSEPLVETRLRMSAPTGDRLGTSVPVPAETGNPGLAESSKANGKAKACDLVPVGPCAWCVRAGVECTFELARAKVEVQAGPLRSENVAGEMLVARGLHAIAAAIDWHTSKMAKHWEMAKETHHMQRQFNNHLYELLQEMEYWEVAEVGESSEEESTGKETSDGGTDKDVEGEEAPESDLEVLGICVSVWGYHKMKTGSHFSKSLKLNATQTKVIPGTSTSGPGESTFLGPGMDYP
ncbi:hypothetical protein EDC04DRAFT_2618805 [Pisolithus marmoratus]|nr:hypothetical protein EDC04DRAFT_2618805 [Pisolithus marmoratus]